MCGCNRGSRPIRSAPAVRPASLTRNVQQPQTQNQFVALGLQQNTNVKNVQQMNAERRQIEKLRRAAIKNALNK